MLIPRFTILAGAIMLLGACRRSADDNLVGEWSVPRVDRSARVTYRADHTYSVYAENLGNDDPFTSTGTWQVQGSEIVSRFDGRETKGTILKMSRDNLEIRNPDGTILHYARVK